MLGSTCQGKSQLKRSSQGLGPDPKRSFLHAEAQSESCETDHGESGPSDLRSNVSSDSSGALSSRAAGLQSRHLRSELVPDVAVVAPHVGWVAYRGTWNAVSKQKQHKPHVATNGNSVLRRLRLVAVPFVGSGHGHANPERNAARPTSWG